jgi:hypothetical protein
MLLPIIVENVDGVLLDRELHLFPHRTVGWLSTWPCNLAAGNDRYGAGRCHSVGGVVVFWEYLVLLSSVVLATPSVLLVLVILSKTRENLQLE